MSLHDQLWGYFSAADSNRSGQLEAHELQRCLSNGSWAPFDISTTLWGYVQSWSNVFYECDRNRSHSISFKELKRVLKSLQYNVSDNFVSLLTYKYSHYGQEIRFDHYVEICVAMHMLTDQFRALDTNQNGYATMQYEQFLSIMFSTR
ncbi:hypothetical protein H696_04755 [Fonticula alba]|uniref:EF-hand domain-containing protein n=1 Tax=Fonticula alba TaxID=691883 RepID=A0A058Z2Z5_FONAL|nr:hypothetical protein H696_04755 [Fonticula alba]KCV68461.1 hypothetical protein H696_04755 [Fonticula alba]|eukprot:XP_009496893.1 hypothetical protein H696_04755 [Fonticula alba]